MDSWILPVVVVAVAAFGLLILVGGAIAAVVWFMRGRKVDPAVARLEGLTNLGYDARPDGSCVYPIQGTQMVFVEGPKGLQWLLRLPRYNTMTLELAEANSGRAIAEPFESGIAAVDQRFVLGSPQADRIVALLNQPKVQKALLRMPNLSLKLSADELIIEDPGKAGIGLLDIEDPVDAELSEHALVINIVNSLFASLYSETGTVLDQYR